MGSKTLVIMTTMCATLFASPVAHCQTLENYKEAGDRYLRAGEIKPAITEYEKALSLDPNSTAVYFNLSIAYNQAHDIKSAASVLEKLVKLSPNDYEAQYNLACLKLYQNDLEAAKKDLAEARSCCLSNSEFAPLIKNTLEFADQLANLDPQTRGSVLLYFLAQHPTF